MLIQIIKASAYDEHHKDDASYSQYDGIPELFLPAFIQEHAPQAGYLQPAEATIHDRVNVNIQDLQVQVSTPRAPSPTNTL